MVVVLAVIATALANGVGAEPQSHASTAAGSGRIVAYSVPGRTTSPDYAVRVRLPGGAWKQIRPVAVTVDLHTKARAALASFDASGRVEVQVTKLSGKIGSARVRPVSLGVTPTLSADDKTATFQLVPPVSASFEVDGDILHNLHIFVHKPDARPKGNRKIIYVGPGEHLAPGPAHVLRVGSNTSLYLAPGALLRGSIEVTKAHNVVIRGHGAIDPSPFVQPGTRSTIYVRNSSDISIRDVTILDGEDGAINITNSKHIVIDGVGEINSDRYSDGIDVFASSQLVVNRVFLRTSDDSMNISASNPWGAHGSTRNVTVRNSSLWADVAHPVLIGVHGNPNGRDKVERIVFQNIDVLEQDEANPLYQGALAVDAGDRVEVENVRFQNIRIADFTRGTLFDVRVFKNDSYNKAAGDGIKGVLFRNVSYTGVGSIPTSHISGYGIGRTVNNVVFENLRHNGVLVLSPQAGNITVGSFVSGLVFRPKPA